MPASAALLSHKEIQVVRSRVLSTVAALAGITPIVVAVMPAGVAHAHGYVSSPASRQAQCAQGVVSCGDIRYEPQSAEGPKGLRSCSGGVGRFAELDDDDKGWRVHPVGRTVSFTWKVTAPHRTANWEYYIGDTRVGFVDGGNEPPPQTFTHSIDLGDITGRHRLLAIWNIGDTANAFYSCIDLDINGGGSPTSPTHPTTTAPTTAAPPTTAPPTTTTPRPPTTTAPPPTTPPHQHPTTDRPTAEPWRQGATYRIGDVVSYNGIHYSCRQAHTVHDPNWTPPNTPALWQRL
ncbi:GlcNAc-binding protein A precursor [Nocardia otitidiscaviarum]|uniref:GlcNAc-binding protein A n=1 Tax=Nocardia otitidiscaviarum TaxID=1823 RepID=A0A378YCJ6_9NOCA|nr:GlcNAc-binding protein A precursor [Nocardia otitidiscaviarum]